MSHIWKIKVSKEEIKQLLKKLEKKESNEASWSGSAHLESILAANA